jgi:hypothetical protein
MAPIELGLCVMEQPGFTGCNRDWLVSDVTTLKEVKVFLSGVYQLS